MRTDYFLDDRLKELFLDDVTNLKQRKYHTALKERQEAQEPGNRSMTYIMLIMKTEPTKELDNVLLREYDRIERTKESRYTVFAISMSHLRYLGITELKDTLINKRLGLGKLEEKLFACVIYQFNNPCDAHPAHALDISSYAEEVNGTWLYLGNSMRKL